MISLLKVSLSSYSFLVLVSMCFNAHQSHSSLDKLINYSNLFRNEPSYPELDLNTYIQTLLTTGKSFIYDMSVHYLLLSTEEWVYEFSYAFNLEDNPAMFVTKSIVSEPTPTHRTCTVHFDTMGGTQVEDRQYNLFSYLYTFS